MFKGLLQMVCCEGDFYCLLCIAKCPELYIGLGTKDKSPVARGVQAIHDKVVEYNELTTQDGEEVGFIEHITLSSTVCITGSKVSPSSSQYPLHSSKEHRATIDTISC